MVRGEWTEEPFIQGGQLKSLYPLKPDRKKSCLVEFQDYRAWKETIHSKALDVFLYWIFSLNFFFYQCFGDLKFFFFAFTFLFSLFLFFHNFPYLSFIFLYFALFVFFLPFLICSSLRLTLFISFISYLTFLSSSSYPINLSNFAFCILLFATLPTLLSTTTKLYKSLDR